jgi:hypothetical protein
VATQKQRRRRAKEHRHEYDLVYIDDEGNEVEATTLNDATTRKPRQGDWRGGGEGRQRRNHAVAAVAVQPSAEGAWARRHLSRRIFLATVMLLGGGKMTIQAAIVQTVLLIAVFIPFSYFMDKLVWRQYQKRLAKGG